LFPLFLGDDIVLLLFFFNSFLFEIFNGGDYYDAERVECFIGLYKGSKGTTVIPFF